VDKADVAHKEANMTRSRTGSMIMKRSTLGDALVLMLLLFLDNKAASMRTDNDTVLFSFDGVKRNDWENQ
jgi:hypothetical protein